MADDRMFFPAYRIWKLIKREGISSVSAEAVDYTDQLLQDIVRELVTKSKENIKYAKRRTLTKKDLAFTAKKMRLPGSDML